MIDGVVALLLQRIVPVVLEAVRVEVPQSFETVTVGAAGVAFGADTPDPGTLVQPFALLVTVYVALLLTVIKLAVEPLLHNTFPCGLETVKVDDPQLFTTVTIGVAGNAFGFVVCVSGSLVQPFTVCVTEYAALLFTTMDVVVAPVLHNNVPVKLDAVNVDDPQLLSTFTLGADGRSLTVTFK